MRSASPRRKARIAAGLHAEDAHDGDLTDEICIAGMSALLDGDRRRIKYVVFDADCHAATLTRTVRYTDYTPPRFALNVPSTYRTGEMPRFWRRSQWRT